MGVLRARPCSPAGKASQQRWKQRPSHEGPEVGEDGVTLPLTSAALLATPHVLVAAELPLASSVLGVPHSQVLPSQKMGILLLVSLT